MKSSYNFQKKIIKNITTSTCGEKPDENNVQQTTEPLTENNASSQEIENKVNEAENKLNKLNQEIKEKEMINIFKKYQVKNEFYDYLKFKTSNIENSKIEETIKKMIKEQPLFKQTINTGGNKQIIINNKTNDKENFLIDLVQNL